MPRGRKSAPAAEPQADTLNHEALAADNAASHEMSQRSMEIAKSFGDGTPYERSRVISEARFFQAASAEAMLELGKRLIQIKENEPHGEFVEIVEERLGMSRRTAQVMMQAAVKYLSPGLTSKAQAPALLSLGRAKLLDLLSVDDDQLEELADGGTVAGLNLDEIQAMSTRELRAALLEARQTLAAKDRVIAKKDDKLNKLAEAEERRRSGTADEREQAQLDELREVGLGAEHALLALMSIVDSVTAEPATEAAELAARQTLDYVAQRLTDACAQRGIAVDVLGERVEPGWRRPITEAVAEYAATKAARGKKA